VQCANSRPDPSGLGGAAAERGFSLSYLRTLRLAEDWGAAVSLGTEETKDSLLLVYRVLDKLIHGQISPRNLGGPVSIAAQAKYAADAGLSQLFLFLTMLSANLAVINFLPIPLLDGGHMVFLILEGLRGKPVSERVVVGFHYLGAFFIVCLMVFVLSLDFIRIWWGN
jgi:regulator of sigma E protease